MSIFIKGKQVKGKDLINKVASDSQISRSWLRSSMEHRFLSRDDFERAIRRNRRALKSPNLAELFTSDNYLFSTKTPKREETLYFKDRRRNQTGRLRQQHSKGPLARIDRKARTHLFLSEKRFKDLHTWRKENKHSLPKTGSCEKKPKAGKRHIECAPTRKGRVRWHPSGGRVTLSKDDLQQRIDRALKEILGLRGE
jgi:hypothetical protein